MNSNTGDSSNNNDCYSSNHQPLSNSAQGNSGLEHLSQFVSMNGTFTQNLINLSHLQNFARQQQQQQQQQQSNLFHTTLATSFSQNQTSAQTFPYYQQATQALHEQAPLSIRQTPSSNNNERSMSDRSKFMVFVKVLLRYLDKLNNERLTQRTKQVIAECTRLHRNGALGYTSLSDALEFRLRSLIGDEHWNRAQNYCNFLIERKQRRAEEKFVCPV